MRAIVLQIGFFSTFYPIKLDSALSLQCRGGSIKGYPILNYAGHFVKDVSCLSAAASPNVLIISCSTFTCSRLLST